MQVMKNVFDELLQPGKGCRRGKALLCVFHQLRKQIEARERDEVEIKRGECCIACCDERHGFIQHTA